LLAEWNRRQELRSTRAIIAIYHAEENAEDDRRPFLPNDQPVDLTTLGWVKFDRVVFVDHSFPGHIAMLIGPGAVRIEGWFLPMTDPNQNRFGFVALRGDGTTVLFYPSSRHYTLPVTCDQQDCAMLKIGDEAMPDAEPAASQGSQVPRRAVLHVSLN